MKGILRQDLNVRAIVSTFLKLLVTSFAVYVEDNFEANVAFQLIAGGDAELAELDDFWRCLEAPAVQAPAPQQRKTSAEEVDDDCEAEMLRDTRGHRSASKNIIFCLASIVWACIKPLGGIDDLDDDEEAEEAEEAEGNVDMGACPLAFLANTVYAQAPVGICDATRAQDIAFHMWRTQVCLCVLLFCFFLN
jgi:hypothetical protein